MMKKSRRRTYRFGTIGTGVARLLQDNKGLISERVGAEIRLKRIADMIS